MHAAAMLARDVPIGEIASQLGVGYQTIRRWERTEAGQHQIAMIRKSVNEGTKHLAVADKVRRIVMAQLEVDRLMELIDIRAHNPHPDVPESSTGIVAVKVTTKSFSKGDMHTDITTVESKYDAALHQQLRYWMEYVAKEKGELETEVKLTHGGSVEQVISRPDLNNLTPEELEDLARIGQKAFPDWRPQ